MEKIWKRIETWLKEHAPDQFAALQPGAKAADIKKAETALAITLPAEARESFSIHDGMRAGVGPLVAGWSLLSLANIVKEWKALKKVAAAGTFAGMNGTPEARIKSDWWNPGWIPLASNSSGDFLCLDLDPGRGGKSGQVISFLHADPARKLVSRDVKTWLTEFATDLERGKYKVEDEWLTKAGEG